MLHANNIPKYIAPLEDFDWDGDEFIINQQLQISRLKVPLNLDDYNGRIAIEDKREINDATHALFYYLKPDETKINYDAFYLFLMSLWIANYSGTFIQFLILEPQKRSEKFPMLSAEVRINDYYSYVNSKITSRVITEDLEKAKSYQLTLAEIVGRKDRLGVALYFTHNANTTKRWQVAFINSVVALEALFSSEKRESMTKIICSRIACFLGVNDQEKVAYYQNMISLYNIRSEIIHGKYRPTLDDKERSKANLLLLYDLQTLLRKCWKNVMSDTLIISKYESEEIREEYLDQLTSGFHPPKSEY